MAFSNRVHLTPIDVSSRRMNSAATRYTVMKTENTYKLEPDLKFPQKKAVDVMKQALESRLANQTYDATTSTSLARELADVIRGRIKEVVSCQRYKIVCFVVLGQADSSALALGSRCVWQEKFDSRAEYRFSNKSLYAVALVFATFME